MMAAPQISMRDILSFCTPQRTPPQKPVCLPPSPCLSRADAATREALAAAGVQLVTVPTRQQAADVQLSTDACQAAREAAQGQQQEGSSGPLCVVVVTSDTDFASLLAYLRGVSTVVLVTTLPSPKRKPGVLPDLQQHPLASAANVVLSWRPRAARAQQQAGPAAAADNQRQRQQTGARVPLPSAQSSWRQLRELQQASFLEAVAGVVTRL